MILLTLALVLHLGSPTRLRVTTDLAQYKPGQVVHLLVQCDSIIDGKLSFAAYRDGEELKDHPATRDWKPNEEPDWTPPKDDGQGYLMAARVEDANGNLVAQGSCAIDVSSTWTTYPRYGYLSQFYPELLYKTNAALDNLKDFHLNALQFYDWQWKHHQPLSSDFVWHDIANRPTSADTVESFIALAHQKGMACMAYNLGYGADDGFEADGVSKSWELFDDADAKVPYSLPMPQGWATKRLYFFDPGNPGWRSYLFAHQREAQAAFHFDGWHMDQVGNPGAKYTASGKAVELRSTFPALLSSAKRAVPGALVFNNVGEYGIGETLSSPTDAMYVEAWEGDGQKTYLDLQRVVEHSRSTGKASILAAYMNYDRAKAFDGKQTPGRFNSHGVLLTDAAIMASGGAHIEIGDSGNLLCSEYFPNRNLEPNADLMDRLRSYYDFSVAYETLLRSPNVRPVDFLVSLTGVPVSRDGRKGSVWTFARSAGSQTVVHLINLLNCTSDNWRDTHATCLAPKVLDHLRLRLPPGPWRQAYTVTPDDGLCIPHPVAIKGNEVEVPSLTYWTMLVLSR